MRVHEIFNEGIIEEGRDAPLYHTMDFQKTVSVLKNDAIPANWDHLIPKVGRVRGNSFTRSKVFTMGGRFIRLVVDQAKLAQTNRIMPVDGERIFRHTLKTDLDKNPERDELTLASRGDRQINTNPLQEEFVIGDIKRLHRCIIRIEVSKSNFYNISGAESFELHDLLEAYGKKYGVEISFDPAFLEALEEIKERWAMDENEELDEAAPDDVMRGNVFYHGVASTMAAEAIMVEGLKGQETQGKGKLAPVAGKVYLTSDISYALHYALGGNYQHAMQEAAGDFKSDLRTDPYGYLFVIKGSDLKDVQPDEDSIGEWMSGHSIHNGYRYSDLLNAKCAFPTGTKEYSVWNFIKSNMTEKQFVDSMQGLYAAWASGGKRALKSMPDWMKVYLINQGTHIAHHGSIMPSECWRILKADLSKLKKDGSNFFQIAKRIK
jgi:hypothetical protein